ncbi:6-phosphogluconolactonase [Nitrosovibrio sp. Nv17]|jgi:6-phosphogluconolactonase|uniref:6-phosphogluconolactonase n=1 Tax=Nitrosovibrio sp. Nv17 TaxID=1855339 RepID=UPI000908DA54|nr:6-phosphogluconolactonase [Nitrosovibrio sp. Nv17]SFW13444.1 6-phosphogluconolactonase [Nitrosovibrio sp. Nv17]
MDNTASGECRWLSFPDRAALEEAALGIILDSAAASIRERGCFRIVLSGGEVFHSLYARIPGISTDWSAWHIYFAYEYCMPPTKPELNFRLAQEAWFDRVSIPAEQIYAIPDDVRADKAAAAYAPLLAEVDLFDLTLLDLGEDGHVASLFPGNSWGAEPHSPDVLSIFNSPRRPPQRVSLSASRLSRSRHVAFLVSGESKRRAVAAWRSGEDVPARAIMPEAGVDVLVEAALLE